MQSKRSNILKFLILIDIGIIMASFISCALLRDPLIELLGLNVPEKDVLGEIWWMLCVSVFFIPFALYQFKFYFPSSKKTVAETLWQVFRSIFLMGGVMGLMVVFLQLAPSSRLATGFSFLSMASCLIIRDRVVVHVLRALKSNSRYKEYVLYAGFGKDLENLISQTEKEAIDFWKIVGTFDLEEKNVEDLREYLDKYSVQRVVIASDSVPLSKLSRLIEICETQGVEAWLNVDFIRTQLARPDFDLLGDKPMLVLRSTPELSWALFCKQVIDTIGSFILLCLLVIPCIIITIAIMITSPGYSPFFIQNRSGKFGRPFKMFKFRTMIPDAEEKLAQIKEDIGNQMDGPVFKLDVDPRVFKFGSFLRKTSLDEIPQLLNVFRGEMSLVGPRPLPVYEVEEISEAKHRRRLSVKPGITCTWQIGGRNDITSFDEWVDMDLAYIDSWSLWKDIAILLKTVPVVLLRRGAK